MTASRSRSYNITSCFNQILEEVDINKSHIHKAFTFKNYKNYKLRVFFNSSDTDGNNVEKKMCLSSNG